MIFSQDGSNLLFFKDWTVDFTHAILNSEKNLSRTLNSPDDASQKDQAFLYFFIIYISEIILNN